MIVVSSCFDDDAARASELSALDVLELEPGLLGDDLAAGEDRDVLEHRLAPIAEAGRLHRDARERARAACSRPASRARRPRRPRR